LAIWGGGSNVANYLIQPTGQLIGAAGQIKQGNLSVRVVTSDLVSELGVLGQEFNKMVAELESQRHQLTQANEQLESRRKFTENVLAGVSSGVIGLDGTGNVHLQNGAARELLNVGKEDYLNKPLSAIAPELASLFVSAENKIQAVYGQQVILERQGRVHVLRVHLQGNWEETDSSFFR